MKFLIKQAAKNGRIGCLTGIEKLKQEALDTPLLLMHTRGGHIPHLTHEVLQIITSQCLLLNIPLSSTIMSCESIAEFGRGIAEFVGLKEYLTYVTPHDPAEITPSGFNIQKKVPIWGRSGKREVSADEYMDIMESFKPDMYLGLCDGDTDSKSSTKRITKSLKRTSNIFQSCLKRHQSSEVLQNSGLLAPIEGAYCLKSRSEAAKEMAAQPVFGYVIDGLFSNGPDAEKISFSAVEAVVSECIRHLPEDRLRVLHGAWTPETVVQLASLGIDIFDGSLTYICTERGSALNFSYSKRPQNHLTNSDCSKNSLKEESGHPYEICLSNPMFKEDFQPVVSDCSCLCCRNHTRAYIHHLLDTKELLAKVLLMIHNIHHYSEFFKAVRSSIKASSLEELLSIVKSSSTV